MTRTSERPLLGFGSRCDAPLCQRSLEHRRAQAQLKASSVRGVAGSCQGISEIHDVSLENTYQQLVSPISIYTSPVNTNISSMKSSSSKSFGILCQLAI